MSLSKAKYVELRIKDAPKDSPIAVFNTPPVFSQQKQMLFNAVFASTVRSQEIIEEGRNDLLGVFYGESGAAEFRQIAKGK